MVVSFGLAYILLETCLTCDVIQTISFPTMRSYIPTQEIKYAETSFANLHATLHFTLTHLLQC